MRPLFPLGIEYSDSVGTIRLDSEASLARGVDVTLFAGRIPDTEERPRERVVANVVNAFKFAGWKLTVDEK
ncbi:hypothetical protein ASD16_20740 [Cellulomonas sp. Root485]|nr:hypothetical protein ASD16_20740 [Cellulomonas sp. Root485]